MNRGFWRPDSCAIQLRVDRAGARQEFTQSIVTAGKGLLRHPAKSGIAA